VDDQLHEDYGGKEWVIKAPLLKVMLKLGIPIAVGESLNLVYNLTDTFWLGRVGNEALAAISASWPVVWLIISAAEGILQAGISLVSQYWGARDWENSMNAAGQVILAVFIVAGPLALVGFFLIPLLLSLLGVPAEVLPQASTYSQIISIGIIFMGLAEGTSAIFSAAGDTLTPLKIRALGNAINMVLDPLLILGYLSFPAMGVAGAAIATIFSQAIAGGLALLLLHSGVKGERLRLHNLKPRKWLLKKLLKVGAPLSILSLGEAGGFTLLVAIISMCGVDALAAWGVGDRVTGLFHIFVSGLLGASATIIGQSLGADLKSRAKEAAVKAAAYGAGIMAIGIGILIPFRYQVVAFFAPNNLGVIEAGAQFILIMGPSVIFFTLFLAAGAVAQGSGHTKPLMIMGLIRLWVLRNLFAFLLGPGPIGWGVTGLWLGMALSNVLMGLVALLWIMGGSWLEPVITQE